MGKKTVLVATLLASFLTIGAAPALADRPDRGGFHGGGERNRIEVLSQRLQGGVRHLEHQAERRIGHRSRRGHEALGALHRLGRDADRFHARVDRHPRAVRRLKADFRALDESFRVAEAHIHRLHAPRLQREIRRIGAVVDEIEHELHRGRQIARRPGPWQGRDRGWHPRYGGFAWR